MFGLHERPLTKSFDLGKSSSDVGIGQDCITSSLLISFPLEKADWNCLFNSSALSIGWKNKGVRALRCYFGLL